MNKVVETMCRIQNTLIEFHEVFISWQHKLYEAQRRILTRLNSYFENGIFICLLLFYMYLTINNNTCGKVYPARVLDGDYKSFINQN